MKLQIWISRIALLLLLAALLAPWPAFAADIEVNAECNLADAIRAANWDSVVRDCPAGAGHDSIHLTGHITLTEALPAIKSHITIEGKGNTISGDNQFRIFHVAPGGLLIVYRLTVIEARGEFGAAMVIEKSTAATINSSVFAGNRAEGGDLSYGGAIYNNPGGTLLVNNSRFVDNSALDGGAIYNDGHSAIRGSTFRNNVATGQDYSTGGALVNRADLDIFTSRFEDNSAGSYGGAISNFGDMNIIRSKFSRNTAAGSGALANTDGDVDIVDSEFVDNSATVAVAGAIGNYGGSTDLFRSQVSGNSAQSSGGGLLVHHGSATVDDVTFDNNSAERGGGIFVHNDEQFKGELHLRKSRVSNNAGGDCVVDGDLIENVDNEIGDGACVVAHTGIPSLDVLASRLVSAFEELTEGAGE